MSDLKTSHDVATEQVLATPQGAEELQKGDDVVLGYYRKIQNVDVSPADDQRVLRKIDLHLLPLLMVTAFLQYLDKQTLNYAAIYQLQPDLHLVGSQYSWVSSMFYFGFLVWQYPSLLLMQRFSVGKYFTSQVLLWGIFSLLIPTTSNFGGIAALRFLLGAAESVQLAAFILITNMYYKRKEQPLRLMIWYAMNGIAIIAGGLFAYGVGHIEGQLQLWKYPFIVCGSLTVAWAVVLFFLLPDNPVTARFLNEEERAIAVARVQENQTGIESKVFKLEQAIEALKEPKIWFNAIAGGSGNILNGIGSFAGLVFNSFGFTALQTQLIQCPVGLIEIISLLIFGYLATRIQNARFAIACTANVISIVGSVMLYAFDLNHRWALVAGFWIMVGFIPNTFMFGLSTIAGNVGGYTKKLTQQAIFFVCYSVGNIVGPQLYTVAPYRQGLRSNVVALCVTLGANLCALAFMIRENRQRRKYLEANKDHLREEDFAFKDLTDRQNPFFINVL